MSLHGAVDSHISPNDRLRDKRDMAKMRATVFLQPNLASKIPLFHAYFIHQKWFSMPPRKGRYHTGMSDIIGRQAGEGLTLILRHFAFLGSEALEKAPRKRDAVAGVSDWGNRIIIPQFSPPQKTVNWPKLLAGTLPVLLSSPGV